MFINKLSRSISYLIPTFFFATYVLLMSTTTYYVDCNGSDSKSGTSPSQAWKTLTKANTAALLPGDSLLFKRGCTWEGTLNASWNGTAAQAIKIGAYGAGALPVIQNKPTDLTDGYHVNVKITGSYLLIENLATTIVNPPVEPGCLNNPVGFFVGFNFINPTSLANSGSNNLLRYSSATYQTIGVHMQGDTHDNRVLNNVFTNNNVMSVLTPISVGATDDIGAWGILLKGENHEIGKNYLSNNNAFCTYDTNPQGNSIELFEAKNNVIHHNIAVNDRVFSELGSSVSIISENNLYAYNLVVSNILDARFISTRGGGSAFGPVYSTQLFQNTAYLTGSQSQGLICGAGCNVDILTAENNIFWAEEKAAFADGAFIEAHNIYWDSSGNPFIQFMGFAIDPTSMIADPMFISPATQDFHLNLNSPGIDAGMAFGWQYDLSGVLVPQGGGNEIGAYEFIGSPPRW